MLIPPLVVRRREQRETKNKKSNVAKFMERQPGNPVDTALRTRIAILGLVPRHRVESREQVMESSGVPDVFFLDWMAPESQRIKRNIVAMSPYQTPRQGYNASLGIW